MKRKKNKKAGNSASAKTIAAPARPDVASGLRPVESLWVERRAQSSREARARPSSSGKYSVFIVDDHPLVCDAISGLINQQKDLMICGTAGDYRGALPAIAATRPKVVVIDISLAGRSGVDLIKDLRARHPEMLTIVFSMHDEALYAARVLQAGARGYIMKSAPPEKIIEGIRQILSGNIALSEPMRERLVNRMVGHKEAAALASPLEALSDRELTVFELIGQGLGSRQIATKINLSIHTVETYRERIKEKLKLRSAPELIQHAVQWVQSGERT